MYKSQPFPTSSRITWVSVPPYRVNITMQPFKGCLKNLKLNSNYVQVAEQVGVRKGCPTDALVSSPCTSENLTQAYVCRLINGCLTSMSSSRFPVKQSSAWEAPCHPTSQASVWQTSQSLCPSGSRAQRIRVSFCRTNSRSVLLFTLKYDVVIVTFEFWVVREKMLN